MALKVVHFRFVVGGLGPVALNDLNRTLLPRQQEGGVAVASGTTIGGAHGPRVAAVDHRSRWEDFGCW